MNAGIPEINRAWLQGQYRGIAKESKLVMTSPLLPEQLSWKMTRVRIGLEQRMSTPTNIPAGRGEWNWYYIPRYTMHGFKLF
jgi:hypothetical protein